VSGWFRSAVVPSRYGVPRRGYLGLTGNFEAMIKIAIIRLMAIRLASEQVRWSNRSM
jgi:hypothetical protein